MAGQGRAVQGRAGQRSAGQRGPLTGAEEFRKGHEVSRSAPTMGEKVSQNILQLTYFCCCNAERKQADGGEGKG